MAFFALGNKALEKKALEIGYAKLCSPNIGKPTSFKQAEAMRASNALIDPTGIPNYFFEKELRKLAGGNTVFCLPIERLLAQRGKGRAIEEYRKFVALNGGKTVFYNESPQEIFLKSPREIIAICVELLGMTRQAAQASVSHWAREACE